MLPQLHCAVQGASTMAKAKAAGQSWQAGLHVLCGHAAEAFLCFGSPCHLAGRFRVLGCKGDWVHTARNLKASSLPSCNGLWWAVDLLMCLCLPTVDEVAQDPCTHGQQELLGSASALEFAVRVMNMLLGSIHPAILR